MVRAVTPIPFVKARFFDRCGKPLAGGKVYTYEANTTTPKATYKDPYGLTPNTNPIILDAAGEADIYLDGTYRIRITDRNDVLVNDVAKIGSWFSDNLQDSLDNVSSAMGEALKPTLQNLNDTVDAAQVEVNRRMFLLDAAIAAAAAAGAGANGWIDTLIATSENVNQRQINDGLDNVAQLSAIKNPRNGQRVYVKSVAAHYIYNSNLTATANGVTVVGKWEMQLRDAYYASWFIADKTNTDNSATLQTAYDYTVSKSKPFVIDIEVHVNPPVIDTKKIALQIRSNSELDFTASGAIRMLANNSDGYVIIDTANAENYSIKNAVVYGDRLTHTGTSGEWGYGIAVYQSKNGFIDRPKVYDCWGDGIYIGREYHLNSNELPTDITIREPFVSGARRNGISFTSGINVTVDSPYITKVGDYDSVVGTWPKAGIDFEPEHADGTPSTYLKNCKVINATIENCYAGFFGYFFEDNLEHTLDLLGATHLKNCHNTGFGLFHGGKNCKGLFRIEHIILEPSIYVAFSFGWSADSNLKCVVEKLTVLNDAAKPIIYTLNGSFTNKKLGNLEIRNVKADDNLLLTSGTNLSTYTDSLIITKDKHSKGNINLYYEQPFPVFQKDANIDEEKVWGGWSTNTASLPNTIWQDPSINSTADIPIYITVSDERRYKIGLKYDTAIVGQGCNINGLNLKQYGNATQAHTKTPGGWIELQNTPSGTIVYNKFGDWTFN